MVLMIVSGRSGSGKSVALRALEDMGFYCVDNLPVVLLPDLARTLADREISAAVSIDVRNMPESPEIFEQAMSNLPDAFSPQLLFLDADRNTLIRRYSDTRRLHPLSSKNLSLESAIDKESDLLEPLRSRADLIVDTSEMSVHELAEMLRTRLLGKRERELTMVFESFGFKHGIPIDADYVFDVRFLPNPHWDPKLRPMTGLDKPVAAFLDRHTEGFDAEVLLRNDEGTEAEANSVIALLMLDSAKGRQIEVEATGPQEEEALAAVIALFNSGFDED
ncbi:PTS-HPr and ATP bind 2 domain containing protein [Trichuris trichiura]|uniref:PTS-HPr and ATP bind 2 domain containing protein n=2 Tax=cellular organisms TaxID=131567 RepID=A0A077ZFA9_TRITR|nr:PTS-HPr and ATP bind 2 domain containing protein [Trichuris trichiura]